MTEGTQGIGNMKWIVLVSLMSLAYAREFIDGDAIVLEVTEDDLTSSGGQKLERSDNPFVSSESRRARQFPFSAPGVPFLQPVGGLPLQPSFVPARSNLPQFQQPPVQAPLGNACVTNEGQNGTCTTVKECYPYFRLFNFDADETSTFGTYDTCSIDTRAGKKIFGICCVEKNIKADLLAEIEALRTEEPINPDEFPLDAQVNENCGKRSVGSNLVRIVNGTEAKQHEFPFMAALFKNSRQFCGGSLLDKTHILTAAHCVEHMSQNDVRQMKVYLGDHNLRTRGEAAEQQFRVKTVVRHKRFKTSTLHNDVAVLTLSEAAVFTPTVQPICLEQDGLFNYEGRSVQVAGWGSIAEDGSQSAILRKVDVEVWSNDKCRRSYGNQAPGGITTHMICAAGTFRDSCSGDSGGPLFDCTDRCRQIGIVSWGIGCARPVFPGVYTRVTELMPWIQKILTPLDIKAGADTLVNSIGPGPKSTPSHWAGGTPVMGHCVTLKSCFPLFNYQANTPSWMMGEKDMCQTTEPTTRQSMAGVCCSTRQFGQYPLYPQYPGILGVPGAQGGGIYPAGTIPFSPGQGGFGTPGFGGSGIGVHPGIPGVVQPPPPSYPVHAPIMTTPTTTTTTTTTTVWTTTTAPTTPSHSPVGQGEPVGSGSVSSGECGVGRHFPISYGENGEDVEAVQRIEGEHPLRVVNGWPADKNEWPWIAALLRSGRQFCGGSLIDSTHILTAAHCVAQMSAQDVQMLTVRLGEHNIRREGESNTFETPVTRVVRHKGFSSDTLYNDVALITLKNAVPESMSDTIRPVCLPSGSTRYTGRLGTVVGWGSLRENGPQPDVLQELTMEIWDNARCDQIYQGVSPAGIKDHMMCAGKKGKDSCSGDSGGPFMIGNGDRWEQVGIVSWGIGCGKADFPGVYTRTTDVKGWIERARNKF
eukprot:maker-scaffold1475_size39547-snap-gene-0.9 protein:Tk06640 transcript:maker-scaffold1475_size39547-snap-gene-0.9-mRNA-1 annotation:"trypsin-1 precursor"